MITLAHNACFTTADPVPQIMQKLLYGSLKNISNFRGKSQTSLNKCWRHLFSNRASSPEHNVRSIGFLRLRTAASFPAIGGVRGDVICAGVTSLLDALGLFNDRGVYVAVTCAVTRRFLGGQEALHQVL